MELSWVICTRNRAAQLRACLASLKNQVTNREWELIVVDNGSADGTRQVIEDFQVGFEHDSRLVFESNQGLGNARNAGWTQAGGDIVLFTDDDCYPAENFLQTVADCFDEDEGLGFLGGRILLYDQSDYPITIQTLEERVEIPARSFIPAGLIQGANFAVRRKALKMTSGFDPIFGPGASFNCEDVDLVARLAGLGWKGAYDPRPLVYHHHGRKTKEQADQLMREYDRGRGAYYVKCMVNPVMSLRYLKNWISLVTRQPCNRTFRELLAGAEYLLGAPFRSRPPAPGMSQEEMDPPG